MFFLLMVCAAFSQLSKATELTKTLKRKRFHDNLQPEDLQELSNLMTISTIDTRERGSEYTALRYAASKAFTGRNSKLICERLLSKGANVNARDSSQSTSLMQAAYEGNGELVQFLLQQGANPYLKNNAGHTALDRANGKETTFKDSFLRKIPYIRARPMLHIPDFLSRRGFTSPYHGVSYNTRRSKWCVKRWSKMRQSFISGSFPYGPMAAHSSDFIVRRLIADGEQGLTYAINFRIAGEWIEHNFEPNCAAMLKSCENDGWCILNVNPHKFLKEPLNRIFARTLICEFLGNAFLVHKK